MKRENLYARSFRGEDGFNEFVSSLGGDPAAVTKASGLVPELPKGLINFESFAGICRLFEEGALQTGEPCFGLKWAFHQPPDFRFSGPMVNLLSKSTHARHWVDMAIEYQLINTNGMSFHYVEDEPANSVVGYITLHPLVPPCRQFIEQFLACFAILARQIIPGFNFNLVTFQHGPPEDMSLYEKAFQCPVIFNADKITVTADHHYLKLEKTSFLSRSILQLVKKYMDWQLVRHPQAKRSISMLVAESLPALIGLKDSSINDVANVLEIHPKKLQRLLSEEGTTYSKLLDDVRRSIAERLLIESEISIVRLARMLDYSSDRPFTAAAKRWFGMTPTEFRKLHNRKDSARL